MSQHSSYKKHPAAFLRFPALLLLSLCALLALSGCTVRNNTVTESSAPAAEKTITVLVRYGTTEKEFVLQTDQETLGGALTEEKLASGTKGDFGLYVTTVNGITADESKQEFWSFSKDGVQLMTGVDSTKIVDGAHYEITLTVWSDTSAAA